MSDPTVELTTRQQVLALQNVDFLSQFRKPVCPSLVADRLGLPANLLHYRVKRLVDLGILERCGREGRRHLYKLKASIFTYPAYLLIPEDRGYIRKLFDQLHLKVTSATTDDPADHVRVDFSDQKVSQPLQTAPPPSSLIVDTFNVPAAKMGNLLESLQRVLQEYSAEGSGAKHTFVMLYFKGEIGD